MNYRHGFHAGNHADVLKHVVLLALCDRLVAKSAPCFALDTHAGRGLYALDDEAARRTGEADEGVSRLLARPPADASVLRYLEAVRACRSLHGEQAYPGSPWILAHGLRDGDRIACCELQPDEAAALKANFRDDPRIAAHRRDGYEAMKALLPPLVDGRRFARGLVLIDPPYEAQLGEFDVALAAMQAALKRWPQAIYALWYPIKRRRSLQPFYRKARDLPAAGVLSLELMVHPDDSPLRMNGSSLLLLNPPHNLDVALAGTLDALAAALAPAAPPPRITWLRAPG
jgi:23S rRNA (adenine2030-N6)-methyltransferase